MAGLGAVGAYMLDLHGHACEQCGNRWKHLGAFNLGDVESHTCARCGSVQWWKNGAPHVLHGSQFASMTGKAPPAVPRTPPVVPPPLAEPSWGALTPPVPRPPLPYRPLLALTARRTLR